MTRVTVEMAEKEKGIKISANFVNKLVIPLEVIF